MIFSLKSIDLIKRWCWRGSVGAVSMSTDGPRIIRTLLPVFTTILQSVISRAGRVAKGRARVPRENGKGYSRNTGLRTKWKPWPIRTTLSIICNQLWMLGFLSCTSLPRTMPSSLPRKILMYSRSVWKSSDFPSFMSFRLKKETGQTDTTSMLNTPTLATTLFENTAILRTPIRFTYAPGSKIHSMCLSTKKRAGLVFLVDQLPRRRAGVTMHPIPSKNAFPILNLNLSMQA